MEFPDFDFAQGEIPLRERSSADHDSPWKYQEYHLSDRERFNLLMRRTHMIESEQIVI